MKAVTALNSVTDVEWLIQVYNAQGEVMYTTTFKFGEISFDYLQL